MIPTDDPLHDAERQMAEHELSLSTELRLKLRRVPALKAILNKLDPDMSDAEFQRLAAEAKAVAERDASDDPELRKLVERLRSFRPANGGDA
jgi:hypothetical protein